MAIKEKITNFKTKLSKFFFRKEKSYIIGLGIGLVVATISYSIFFMQGFSEMETYLQALVYQVGYNLPKDPSLVTVVKKDQTSSSLLKTDPGRQEFASIINLLGSRQKKDRMIYKSRSQTFELLSINLGLYNNIRNQRPIATSFDEWREVVDISDNKNKKVVDFFEQDKFLSTSRQVLDYFKKHEKEEGFSSFIKVTGKAWNPKGTNIFKILAGGSKYLVLPTLCIPWSSKEIQDEVEELSNKNISDNNKRNNKLFYQNKYQTVEETLQRWVNFFENIQYSEIVYDVRLFPKPKKSDKYSGTEKNFFTLSIKLKTYGRDTSYVVEPASVIGFDYVLQGKKDHEYDNLLIDALNNTQSQVILAAYRKIEQIQDEALPDESTFSQVFLKEEKNGTKYAINRVNESKNLNIVEENFLIKPDDIFLANKEKVDYAMIDMRQESKSYIKEAPIIIKVKEHILENGKSIATETIKPSFALRIALEKLDYDNKKLLTSQLTTYKDTLKSLKDTETGYAIKKKELEKQIQEIQKTLENQEYSYVKAQREVFTKIRKDFCEGKFSGELQIKDLKIPLNSEGRLYINFAGSTRKGSHSYAGIDSVSLFECLEENLLINYLTKNPESTSLSPRFAHRRTLNPKNNKGGRIFVFGPFESTDFDFYPTPVSYKTPFQISNDPLMGVEIHANIIMNILTRNFIRHPNPITCRICIFVFSIFTGLVLEMVSPFVGAFLALFFAITTFSYSLFSYNVIGQVFLFAPLLFCIFCVWLTNTLINYVKQRIKARSTKEMFSKFVSADVVQYMLDNPDLVRPGGSKTELTIFFSDVAGFTSISEALSPEDLVVLLNEYLGAMTDLLFEYGGTLDKFIGDAVMAFWNFPKKQEDHAVRAVLCAIAMQKKIAELQKDWAKRGLPKVAARCGINTQDVVVGYMGSQKAQMNFTCMGDGVNLASRLEGANKEYGTMMMVSDATYQKVKHAVRGRFLDFLAVKGKKEPVKVHELVCKIGDEPEGWFERTELYDKAIQLHLERKWDEAIATFEEVLKLNPNDGPSKTYINRCNEYKINPPPEGWDGRYILTHK